MFIPGGQKFLTHSRGEVKHFYAQRERGKHFYTQHFYTQGGGTNNFKPGRGQSFLHHIWRGDKHSYSRGGGGDKHFMLELVVDEDEDVSEANIIPSKGNKLSAGARVLRDL